jgi:ribonuclease-3
MKQLKKKVLKKLPEFKDQKLKELALTHRSYLNESKYPVSNERLEFLGDAVLELVTTEFLYHHKPDEQEGVLTAARANLVRTETLAEIAQEIDLGSILMMSQGEEKMGGRTNTSILADTYEAFVGGLFLDGGLDKAKKFIEQTLMTKSEEILSRELKDPKTLYQEKVQEKGYLAPTYKTLNEQGPDHNKTFTVAVLIEGQETAQGMGRNKQTAQQEAAQKGIDKLDSLPNKQKIV